MPGPTSPGAAPRLASSRWGCYLAGLTITLALACLLILAVLTLWPGSLLLPTINVAALPPGSVARVLLPDSFREPAPPYVRYPSALPEPAVWLVHDREQGVLALYNRDPGSGCQVNWGEHEQAFIDPCHGSRYTLTGTLVHGPATRDLDQLEVLISGAGVIQVDLERFRMGKQRP